MAKVEVDEAELATLRGVTSLVNQMMGNKEARPQILRARKAIDPNFSIPEIDVPAPFAAEIDGLKKQLGEEREAREKFAREESERRTLEAAQREIAAQESRLLDAGWTREGITKIREHATTRGIPDLEVAAAHYEKLNPPAELVSPNGQGMFSSFDAPEDDAFMKAMIESRGEDEGALNREVAKVLKETREQRR